MSACSTYMLVLKGCETCEGIEARGIPATVPEYLDYRLLPSIPLRPRNPVDVADDSPTRQDKLSALYRLRSVICGTREDQITYSYDASNRCFLW